VTDSEAARVVQTAIDAFLARDVETWIGSMTPDVIFEPSAFITGRGRYEGHDELRAGMVQMEADLEARREQVILEGFRHYVDDDDPDVVLSLGRVLIERANGERYGSDVAYLSTLRGNKICRLRTWLDHAEGLAQLSSPRQVELG
jgi:ketosteroid isomerase-like protein